jgi:hypothetical protein
VATAAASAAKQHADDNDNPDTQEACFRVCLCFHDGVPFFELLRLAARRRAGPGILDLRGIALSGDEEEECEHENIA